MDTNNIHSYCESRTAILPIQINKVGTYLWKDVDKLADGIARALAEFNMGKKFTWKKIVNDNEAGINASETKLASAFESESNLKEFNQTFTPEVADALHGKKIVQFIAQSENSAEIVRGILGIASTNNTITIQPVSNSETILFEIRKIYLSATVFGTCLLTIEMHENYANNENGIILNDDYWDIESICHSLGIIGYDSLQVLYPTKCHSYVASLVQGKNITSVGMEYKRTSIRKTISICAEEKEIEETEIKENIVQFFGKTFECFWIAVLQKSVAMCISSWAGSEEVSNSEFNSVYKAYVKFDNQFNFLEVSYNPDIQGDYDAIKSKMNIENAVEKLIRQVGALHSVNSNEKAKKRNNILAFISALSLVTGVMQVTESFGPSPNSEANTIAGILSAVTGVLLFIVFVK